MSKLRLLRIAYRTLPAKITDWPLSDSELRTLPRALHGDVFPDVTTEAAKRS